MGASAPVFNSLLDDHLGLAWSLQALGQRGEAREIARQVSERATLEIVAGERGYYPRLRLAVSEMLLGDTLKAVMWVDSAVRVGYRDRRILETVPTLAPLRSHPRFREILVRVDSLLGEERRRVGSEGWGVPRGSRLTARDARSQR